MTTQTNVDQLLELATLRDQVARHDEDLVQLLAARTATAYRLLGGTALGLSGCRALVRELLPMTPAPGWRDEDANSPKPTTPCRCGAQRWSWYRPEQRWICATCGAYPVQICVTHKATRHVSVALAVHRS